MASNQPQSDGHQLDPHQLEAATAYVKHMLAEQQAQQQAPQPPTAPPQQPSIASQAQLLSQLLGSAGAGAPAPQMPQAAVPPPPQQQQQQQQQSLGRLVAEYLKAMQPQHQGQAPAAPVPPSLLANLQAAAAPAPHAAMHPQAPRPPPQQQQFSPPPALPAPQPALTNDAARRQLLASAQLLSSVNPGLAAAAMAQALTMPGGSPPQQGNPHPAPHQLHPVQAPAAPHHLMTGQQPQPQQQMPQLPQPSAGQAAAQFRQVQNPRRPSAQQGAPPVHSNRSSPGIPPAPAAAQERRPSSALTAPTKPSVALHQISSGGSLASGPVPARRPSALQQAQPSSNKKHSPKKNASFAASTASMPSVPTNPSNAAASALVAAASNASLASGARHLPKPVKPIMAGAAAIHRHRGHPGSVSSTAAVASVPSQPVQNVPITTLQRWSLEQLESHVNQLRGAKQPIPQAVALLLADVRRKEERRKAKRLANRRSACTSRARKKALIEEMTRDNARLRRQALILSYLPDPVVAISADGTITFVSMQVERVLKHRASSLVGANIEDIIVPRSREPIRRLIRDLVVAERQAAEASSGEDDANEEAADGGNAVAEAGAPVAPHEVSEHSSEQSYPPLVEVKVKAGQTSTEVGATEDVSDSSGDARRDGKAGAKKGTKSGSDATTPTEMSSLTHKNSSFGPESGEEPVEQPKGEKAKAAADGSKPAAKLDSDDSTSSENKANANLTKNVEMCKLNKAKNEGISEGGVRFGHKDDVMGATVTANNADAKLSSLMHHPSESKAPPEEEQQPSIRRKHVRGPKMAANTSSSSAESSSLDAGDKAKKRRGMGNSSSEDSGYRESNESPEEGSNEYPEDSSSSSVGASSERSSKKKRKRTRPLAPACNVRLIRDDLSTLWCELTSSIRTRPPDDLEVAPAAAKQGKKDSGSNDSAASSAETLPEEKELLLCFRPIREGQEVGEELRFRPRVNESDSSEPKVSSSGDGTSGEGAERAAKKQKTSDSSGSAGVDPSSSADPSSTETQAATAPSMSSPTAKAAKKKNRPPKKRKFETEGADEGKKRPKKEDAEVDERSAVESMMELAKKK